ncbi:VOC family protein [Amphiplicatus metriothermophilus]|uniref:Catechol 2,3-dioxygenase n=1 Tax=Amphiplicatus metriothermophilus TaxID=1519374 RepID=A0A239PPW9_9PROT|nr:VOC family protein [Amphiplicatus metriothermophilus]MBB5518740.1 catechol 2,3-dioxygenase-like lactoylglutathione lyase family enzyme [Amphiplicatus metriothermophilus]SNT72103.1 Catechol 2,3-dioxygenase [Amphiplicatus metriothermophilus]
MKNIIDHLSVGVGDLEEAARFYDPVLGTIGVRRLAANHAFVAYGVDAPQFLAMSPYDKRPATWGNGAHVSFAAESREAVDAFHRVALSLGGMCEGAPGERRGFPGDPGAYMAYVRDPFGNKLEVVHNGFSA